MTVLLAPVNDARVRLSNGLKNVIIQVIASKKIVAVRRCNTIIEFPSQQKAREIQPWRGDDQRRAHGAGEQH